MLEKNDSSVSPEFSASADSNSKNSKNNLDLNSQENTEENSIINNLELLNLNLTKSQSEELNHKNYDLNEVGYKLFPGIYKYKNYNLDFKTSSSNINNMNIINNEEENIKKGEEMTDNFIEKNNCINNQNNFKQNFLYKTNINTIKKEYKDGLALAYDYYSSFLEDKNK